MGWLRQVNAKADPMPDADFVNHLSNNLVRTFILLVIPYMQRLTLPTASWE